MNVRNTVDGCPLTARELECVEWLAAGKTLAEIGLILGISKNTIMKRVEAAKLNACVGKDTALVAKALRAGWIQ